MWCAVVQKLTFFNVFGASVRSFIARGAVYASVAHLWPVPPAHQSQFFKIERNTKAGQDEFTSLVACTNLQPLAVTRISIGLDAWFELILTSIKNRNVRY